MGGTPSALEAAWAKHQRALHDLAALDEAVSRFLESGPYRVEVAFDAGSGWHVAKLRIGAEPPAALSVYVGALAHQCYSAINHVVWRLVERKMGARRANDQKYKVALPLCKSPASFANSFTAKNVSKPARELLESLQPYHRIGGRHPIVLLKELADADKHRVLAPSYGLGHLGDVLAGRAFTWDEAAASEPTLDRVLPRERDPFTVPDDSVKDGDTLVRIRFRCGNEEAKLAVWEQPAIEVIFESDSAGITLTHLRSLVEAAHLYLARLATLFPREVWPPT